MNWLLWLQVVVEIIKVLVRLGIIKEEDAQKTIVSLMKDKSKEEGAA